MLRRPRELGPPFLVPLAWTFVTAAHLGWVREYTLFVAHVVMAVLLIGFAVTGYADMREGVLWTWWKIIAFGSVVTLCGVVGLWLEPVAEPLVAVALFGWMGLPAVGFVVTGRRLAEGTGLYGGAAAACVLGGTVYAGSLLTGVDAAAIGGLTLVGLGQTVGIVEAALRS